jgi:hypothetical protein
VKITNEDRIEVRRLVRKAIIACRDWNEANANIEALLSRKVCGKIMDLATNLTINEGTALMFEGEPSRLSIYRVHRRLIEAATPRRRRA